MKKVGFFGGSFDPIHLGHLNLAVSILEKEGLDEILFCPAHISPAKENAPPIASPQDRLKMVELALEGLPCCRSYDGELSRPPPSFTIDTVREIEGELFLVVAEDAASSFAGWKEIEALLEEAPPLIGVRHGFDRSTLQRLPEKIWRHVERGLREIPAMDISSTQVRERLKKGLYCGHLVPGKVLDYIHQNTIYSSLYE